MTEQPNVSPSSEDSNGAAPEKQAAAVLEDLEALRSRIAVTERERDKYLDLLQRTRADFENYQKRIQRDLQQERQYSAGLLAQDLLPVLDNLERALAAARQANESGPLVQGVSMVFTQFQDALKRHGITRIVALHETFDPTRHQAVMQQPSADQPPGKVLQVLQEGYMIHDRVLRPATVVVSVAPENQ
jgi:molecular chaperone GrpE